MVTNLALQQTKASAMTLDTQTEATTLMVNVRPKVTVRRGATAISMESGLVMVATDNNHTASRLPTVKTPSLRAPKVRVVLMEEPLKAMAIAVDPPMDMPLANTAPIEGWRNEIFLVH